MQPTRPPGYIHSDEHNLSLGFFPVLIASMHHDIHSLLFILSWPHTQKKMTNSRNERFYRKQAGVLPGFLSTSPWWCLQSSNTRGVYALVISQCGMCLVQKLGREEVKTKRGRGRKIEGPRYLGEKGKKTLSAFSYPQASWHLRGIVPKQAFNRAGNTKLLVFSLFKVNFLQVLFPPTLPALNRALA